MSSVVPSQVVKYIDAAFSSKQLNGSQQIDLTPEQVGALNALIKLVSEIPSLLLPSDPVSYAEMVQSIEAIRFTVRRAESQNPPGIGPWSLPVPTKGKPTAVGIIRQALVQCPDEVTPAQSQEFLFIKDAEVRSDLLRDLVATRSSLLHGEWKAATVIAGSIVEALLLWGIENSDIAKVQNASKSVVQKGALTKSLPADHAQWGLHQLVEVAAELGLLEPDTATEARLAKDFRNLIHPGRALKKQQTCDRGTALVASAAVEHVARDLRNRFH